MAIREGAWDCPSCGHVGNPGSAKQCSACGTVRGDDVQFYLPEEAKEVTEQEHLVRAAAGPDWKCPYCGGDNPDSATSCTGCGSPRDGTEKRETRTILDQPAAVPVAASSRPNWWGRIASGCCLIILLFFVGCFFLTRTTDTTLQIQSMSWQRSVDVQKLGMVTEEGWQGRGEVPAGAQVLSRSQGIREHRQIQTGSVTRTRTNTERVQTGTRQVKVGVKDLGNGYFEDVYKDEPVYESRQVEETYQEPVYRQEPVYDTRVRYQIEKWHKDGSVQAQGDDNKPRWPDVAQNARQKPGERTAVYKITLTGNGKTYLYQPTDENQFTPFSPGETVTASVMMTGDVTEIRKK